MDAGVPWRVVTSEEDWSGLEVLYCFANVLQDRRQPQDLRMVSVPDLPGWRLAKPTFLARHAAVRSMVCKVLGRLFQAYFRRRWMRGLVDGLGLVHAFWGTPHFRLPSASARQTLLATLSERVYPRVDSGSPVLAEVWQRGETLQLHLANYADSVQTVAVAFGRPVIGEATCFPGGSTPFRGSAVELELDLYAVLEYAPQ